jgi:pimeloyl-ACP methyl ester carboxylesterase
MSTLAAHSFLRIPLLVPASTAPTRKRTTSPLLRAMCAYALQEGQSRHFHRLPWGHDLEVIAQRPPVPLPQERPPLVFVHGSFHAAWCWAEHWMPFFSRAGFPCYALSLRAQVVACSGCSSDCVNSMRGCYLLVL